MNDALSNDEYDALNQISAGSHSGRPSARPSACVARNSKRLSGLKFISIAKDGSLLITPKGKQALFIRSCIDGMRAIAADPTAPLSDDVKTFLSKKGHLIAAGDGNGYVLTPRGAESLEDIENAAS